MPRLGSNGETGPGHNALSDSEITKLVKEVALIFDGIKADRLELNEKAGKARQRLKDAGIDTKAFEAVNRLASMSDEAARDNYLTWFGRIMSATGIAVQGDLLEGLTPPQVKGGDDAAVGP